jgi:hypothetical protein
MRARARATALLAALVAAPIALIGPSAQAATAGRLVGTASCAGDGTIRLATSIDASRTAKAVATVSGAKQARWAGELIAGVDETSDTSGDATKTYVAERGTFTAVATRTDASSADALAYFMSSGMRSTCSAMLVRSGTTYLVADAEMRNGLALVAGPRDAVDASFMAQPHHRYRAAFTVVGAGAPQHFSSEKTAQKRGVSDIIVRHVKRLSAFSKVSLTVTDLSAPKSQPLTYSIGR